ncbi:porin [Paraburkholderia silvatlantica]|uniref:Porin n=1 Tax=Paraburkholderia silvatlantica TaxID=321895 RepID=A0A2U0ZGB7_9BURK|nr:porin [Paraburkholderia silvatlantica]MBB2926345.1 putative porin [Paraburkholderia silvatlantica]PVY17927.1 putative outer membrane protein [Paraburkholderia silvatlantica]PXW24117.1 putative outer membrane protein [Paraburkholderia silvatlantica]PYE12539.1 putative outer membrane protein [Paraburkholderia silvatlantica]TDQ73560.1 putative outer membrane protein [Paraburkholderia silvatlantica]
MKKISIAVAVCAASAASAANAQSSVTLYGLIDAGIAYTNNVQNGAPGHGSARVALASGNISGSRFGLRGSEDLGGGLHAIFVLENGFNVNNGTLGQGGRMFGRQAFVGVSGDQYGTLTMGRQYDSMVDFVSPLSGTAGTFGDAGFAHVYDNDNLQHTVRFSNSVKFASIDYAGFKFGGMYAFSNSTSFAVDRAYSAGASYNNGPLRFAAAYLQINGSAAASSPAGTANQNVAADPSEFKSTAGGGNLTADVQRTVGAGVGYTFGPAAVNFVYTHSQYQNTSAFGLNPASGSTHFDNYELNVKYALTPALSLGLMDTFTDGHLNGVSKSNVSSDPKWNQVNAIARYSLSKRTEVYGEAMYQRAIGHNNVAALYNAGGFSATGNQVMAAVGMLTRF